MSKVNDRSGCAWPPAKNMLRFLPLWVCLLAMTSWTEPRAAAAAASETPAPETAALRPGEAHTFDGIQFAWIPPGTFQMGSQASPDAIARKYGGEAQFFGVEHPQHQVTLTKGFWMGCYPVLNVQFEAFVTATGYRTEAEREGWGLGYDKKIGHSNKVNGLSWRQPGYPIDPRQPVVMVGWNDAQEYIPQDWMGAYPDGPVVDPTGPSSGTERILRGGSWHSPAVCCRSANRRTYSPGSRNISLGFRLVRIAAPGTYRPILHLTLYEVTDS